ncbi:MAG: FMN-binding glutamate synthase family protein [Acetobacteraceae bacterium]|nr:FMN-binding glutamate synthase family protein [Acetobacteraceae bacterium]
MTTALVLLLLAAGLIAALYLHDTRQSQHTILRNFPVLGHFRYFSESFGEYMRQYQYLPDWVERPFNRLERAWIYRTAKGISNLISFGSEAAPPFAFRPAAFAVLDEECGSWQPLRIGVADGPGASREPYDAPAFFNISGMSYGALSHAAVSALSRGARMAGVWMATGEGGLAQYHLEGGCDLVMQIGTAKYGVRDQHGNLSEARLREIAAHPQVRMFEVKLAQGAKPGKGGILPAAKVTAEIAAIRGIPEGKPSISPNRHTDIATIAELGAFVDRVRRVTGKPVGVKFVVGQEGFLDDWFADCTANPAHCPDYIQVDGGEGGTGAAPAPLADYVGLPITQALPLVAAARARHGLGARIRIIASGKLITPDKVAWALCMGADFVSSARGFMFALGCIQAMKCGSGQCPTGITSADPRLIRGLDPTDKSVRVMHYAKRVREEVEMIAHACGLPDAGRFTKTHVTDIERGVGGFRNADS